MNKEKFAERLCEMALACGAFEVGVLGTQELSVYEEVRNICKGNACGKYAKTWACPPAVGTIEECLEKVKAYDLMLLFTGKYELEDSFDYEGMMEGKQNFVRLAERFERAFSAELDDYLFLSAEGCHKCEICTYPEAPCRFPDKLHFSLEGYGFNVSELAKKAVVHYFNGVNTVTYFGALCFDLRR